MVYTNEISIDQYLINECQFSDALIASFVFFVCLIGLTHECNLNSCILLFFAERDASLLKNGSTFKKIRHSEFLLITREQKRIIKTYFHQ